ncbi:MAG: magnesium transporter CorA family protein [Clostridia bacterium]|mgnify:FL=1|nr:magnesium transporter CorA family protein [Clostridia bacterium]
MLSIYNTDLKTNKFEKIKEFRPGSWINLVNPTAEEIATVCSNLKIEDEFIKYPLDYDEQARIDVEDDMTLFVIDVPVIEEDNEGKNYSTMPLGLIVVRDEYFISVALKKTRIIDAFEKGRVKGMFTYKKTRFLLQILYLNASYYLNDLKKINKEAENTVNDLKTTMKNQDLMKLLRLENSLVYITTSLKANEVVMEKTARGKVLKSYEEDDEILEDAIIENRQAIEMGKIYREVLNGTMDAYASIISNNLNVVMKFLASMTIVLSLPTLIASIWGMNVPLPFATNPYGFGIVCGISVLVSVIAFIWLKKKDML